VTAGVFFAGPAPTIEPLEPRPYTADEHLADELDVAGLCFLRLGRSGPEGGGAPDLDARIAGRRRAIAARVAATEDDSLPLRLLARRLPLGEIEAQIVTACLAAQLDPELLPGVDAGGAPLVPTPKALRDALAPAEPMRHWMAHFIGRGGLVDRRVLLVKGDAPSAARAAEPLTLNPLIAALLLGRDDVDPLLCDFVRTCDQADLRDDLGPIEERLGGAVAPPATGHALWLLGPDRLGAWDLVRCFARVQGRPLLELDAEALAEARHVPQGAALRALGLMQRATGAIVGVRLRAAFEEAPHRVALVRLLRALGGLVSGPVVTTSETAPTDLSATLGGALVHSLPPLGAAARLKAWAATLGRVGVRLSDDAIERLADDFALLPGEIDDLVHSLSRSLGSAALGEDVIRQACTDRLGARLGRLADLVVTPFQWSDLVLPDEELAQLQDMVVYQAHRHWVFSAWNMASKLPYGGGTAALFWGPPGTGKTMAASVIANALGRELHRVDLSRVVDKFIGETEKNLARVFDAAAEAHAVLLFDEADSLFARRTSVSSSNDRYANLETNFLLQRMDAHPGITILTTNQIKAVDEAFLRRIRFKVEFPFPDEAARAALWAESLPAELPLADDVDPTALGERFELSGGHIRMAVLRAAFCAAAAEQPVSQDMLVEAALFECQALGKLIRS